MCWTRRKDADMFGRMWTLEMSGVGVRGVCCYWEKKRRLLMTDNSTEASGRMERHCWGCGRVVCLFLESVLGLLARRKVGPWLLLGWLYWNDC